MQAFVTLRYTFCEEKSFQTAVLTNSSSASIQWEFQAVSMGVKIFLLWDNQLKSFVHLRINLSPFTKDFRVRGTPIEKLNYLSSFLRGSNLAGRILGSFEAKATKELS